MDVSALKNASESAGKIADKLESAAAVLDERSIKAIHESAVNRLLPEIRGYLGQNFDASGIGTLSPESYHQTGQLRRMCVDTATVKATASGFVILAGAGFDAKLYKAFGSLNFGSLHGFNSFSKKPKAKVKKAYLSSKQPVSSGVRVTPPRPFFELLPGQMAALVEMYCNYMAEDINARLAG